MIIGCGYTGTRLARALVGRAASITVVRRTIDGDDIAGLGPLGVRAVCADLADPASLDGLVPADSIAVCLAPPGADPGAEIRALIDAARDAARVVYVSSSGVYAAGGGAWVDEGWPIDPMTHSGRARAAAEAELARTELHWIALRAAGIHGPGRGLVDRIRTGSYRIIGDGTTHVSRIHVDDLVAAIIAAGTSSVHGYVNVADDDPAPIGEVGDAIAAALGVAPPPRLPVETVTAEIADMLTADRKICNARMKRELGVVLRYPSWRSVLGG